MSPDEKLKQLGIELPPAPRPLGSYVAARQSGDLLFISGMLPLVGGELKRTGLVGKDLTPEEGQEEARIAAINGLAVLRDAAGGFDKVAGCVKVTGYIASASGFTGQPGVLNAVSDLVAEVFGEAGKHARVAVGVPVLPMGAAVEVEFIFELEPRGA